MLENLSQADHPHTLFSDQPFFYKLLIHIFSLELDTLPYPMLYDFIHVTENQNSILLCKIPENEDELFITALIDMHLQIALR